LLAEFAHDVESQRWLRRALQALGERLGDDLMPANEFNARGYFESNEIVALHDQVLETLGLT
jgi:hypothetical protein